MIAIGRSNAQEAADRSAFLEELERRHNAVLEDLERLEQQVEAALRRWAAAGSRPSGERAATVDPGAPSD